MRVNEGFREYLSSQYTLGYDEGAQKVLYTGRTFIGYYGYLDGLAKENKT